MMPNYHTILRWLTCLATLSTSVLPGTAADNAKSKTFADRPHIVMLSAENEYQAAKTLPKLANTLESNYGFRCTILQGSTHKEGPERNFIPGMKALESANLVILFVRRRALPAQDMQRLRHYLTQGNPLIAIRTASHAFDVRGDTPSGLVEWEHFDEEVLGGNYHGYPHGETRVHIPPEAANHPILKGLTGPYQVRETMYLNRPLADSCQVLLMGTCVNGKGTIERYHRDPKADIPDEPVAWTHSYHGGKIFYTSLGSGRASFQQDWYHHMLINAVHWALNQPVP